MKLFNRLTSAILCLAFLGLSFFFFSSQGWAQSTARYPCGGKVKGYSIQKCYFFTNPPPVFNQGYVTQGTLARTTSLYYGSRKGPKQTIKKGSFVTFNSDGSVASYTAPVKTPPPVKNQTLSGSYHRGTSSTPPHITCSGASFPKGGTIVDVDGGSNGFYLATNPQGDTTRDPFFAAPRSAINTVLLPGVRYYVYGNLPEGKSKASVTITVRPNP